MTGERAGMLQGVQALGILAHDVLFRVMDDASPSWGKRLPPNDARRASDSSTFQRQRIQKKAWRSKCVLKDPKKRNDILLYSLVGEAVEQFIQEVQYQDERPGALYDLFLTDEFNPVFKCRRSLCEIASAGCHPAPPLAPVFQNCQARFSADEVVVDDLIEEARCLSVDGFASLLAFLAFPALSIFIWSMHASESFRALKACIAWSFF
jgi:hypothetical protein